MDNKHRKLFIKQSERCKFMCKMHQIQNICLAAGLRPDPCTRELMCFPDSLAAMGEAYF